MAWGNRGITFARHGDLERAIGDLNRAIELDPRSAFRYRVRGGVLLQAGQFRPAMLDLEYCLAQTPTDVRVLERLAWLLATCEQEDIRDGARAVDLARRACELDQWRQAPMLGALAAAYAEVGQFGKAVEYQRRAIAALGGAEAGEYGGRLDLYEAGRPCRR